MGDFAVFVVAVVFVVINGLTMLAWAASQGFKLKPTAFAYIMSGAGNLIAGSVTPISGQSSILAITDKVKDVQVRIGALVISSVVITCLGLTKSISVIHAFAGTAVMRGMLAGVGIMLMSVCFDMVKHDKRTGIISFATALITWSVFTYFIVSVNALVWVIAVSVGLASLDFSFVRKKRVNLTEMAKANGFIGDVDQSDNAKFWTKSYWADFKIIKPKFIASTVYYALAFVCVSVGTMYAFGSITGNMAFRAHGINQNFDHLAIINGMGGILAILFGGSPIETIISATALTKWPVLAGATVMFVLAILLLIGAVVRLIKYVPVTSIAGFLFIIGFFSTFIPNIRLGMGENAAEASVAMVITALTRNPFLGLVLGVGVRYIGVLVGIV